MGKIKSLAWFSLGAIFFAACGTAEIKFPYEYFHMSPIRAWEYPGGELVGKGVRYPLTKCAPIKNNEGKLVQQCVIVFYSELNKLVTEYKQTKQALIDCQRGQK